MSRLITNLSTIDQAWDWDKISAHDSETTPVEREGAALKHKRRVSVENEHSTLNRIGTGCQAVIAKAKGAA